MHIIISIILALVVIYFCLAGLLIHFENRSLRLQKLYVFLYDRDTWREYKKFSKSLDFADAYDIEHARTMDKFKMPYLYPTKEGVPTLWYENKIRVSSFYKHLIKDLIEKRDSRTFEVILKRYENRQF